MASGVGPASNSSLLGGARGSPGQGEAGFADKTVSHSKTWRRPKVKSVLSREEVTALLQGLSQDEPDHQISEPGPAKERQESEGLRGKTGNQADCRKGWPRDGILTLFNPFDKCNGNDTNGTP